MKHLVWALVLFVIGCSKPTSENLTHLNGYWEIESAVTKDGDKREYTINPTVDYFELKGNKGIRKKLMAQFDGTFLDAGNPAEPFEAIENEDGLVLRYTMPDAKWEEKVTKLDENKFEVKTNHGMTFTYKRYKPLLDETHE